MRQEYADIRGRLGEPQWYDENGVPRYDPFHPSLCSDTSAQEVVLLLVECCECGEPFEVAITRSLRGSPTLAEEVVSGTIHYGLPPMHDWCYFDGQTKDCIDRRVLEFWRRDDPESQEWRRVRALEGEIKTVVEESEGTRQLGTEVQIESDAQRLREISQKCRMAVARNEGRSIDASTDFWTRVADNHEAMLSLLREAHEMLASVGILLCNEPPAFANAYVKWMCDVYDLCGWPVPGRENAEE